MAVCISSLAHVPLLFQLNKTQLWSFLKFFWVFFLLSGPWFRGPLIMQLCAEYLSLPLACKCPGWSDCDLALSKMLGNKQALSIYIFLSR